MKRIGCQGVQPVRHYNQNRKKTDGVNGMGVFAEQIIHAPLFATAQVRAGESRLKQNEVEWVSVMETPVENFIREKEFVLTTGIGIGEDADLLEKFVSDVIHSGASMLGIATGRHIFDIPDRVLQLAEDHGFIIVDLPWDIRFGDVISTVLDEINKSKQEERQVSEEIRLDFLNQVLQEGDLQEIAELLHRHTRMPAMITEFDGTMRAYYDVSDEVLTAVEAKQWTRPKAYEIEQHLGAAFSEHRLHPHIFVYDTAGERWCRVLIHTKHRKQGFVWFRLPDGKPMTWFTMNVLEHAVTACALFFIKEDAVEAREIKVKDSFILQLAKEEPDDFGVIRSKAELLGYDLDLPYVCIVGRIHLREDESEFPSFHKDNPPTSSLQNVNYYIQKEINSAARFIGRRAMATFDEDEVIVFLEAAYDVYTETANQFLDYIERRLSDMLTEIGLRWGISVKKEEANGFHLSYREAYTALEIGIRKAEETSRTFYKDTRINRVLLAMSANHDIQSLVHEIVKPLADYDEKRQTDLIHTFMTYNRYSGNVSQTARALHLHRQSLLYRLRNIESLTGLSLLEADDVFLLELTIRLWQLKDLQRPALGIQNDRSRGWT